MTSGRRQWAVFGRSEMRDRSRPETDETGTEPEALAPGQPPPPSSEVHRIPGRQRSPAVLRALVVDRDGGRRDAVRTLLERERFEVDGADSESAAEHALDRSRYDLLFVDVSAERERALSLIERAKTPRARVTTPVVVATGDSKRPEAMFETLRAGAIDYLPHHRGECESVDCATCEASAWCQLPERLSAAAEVCGRMRPFDDEAAAIKGELAAIEGELAAPSSRPSSLAAGMPVRHGGALGSGHVTAVGALGSDTFAFASDDLGRVTAVLIDLGVRGLGSALRLATARVAATAALERGKGLQDVAEAVAEACDDEAERPASPGLTLVRLTPAAGLVEVFCAGMPAVVGATAGGELRTFACAGPRLVPRRARLVPVRRGMVRPGEAFLLTSDGLTLGALDEPSAETLARRIGFDRCGASMAAAAAGHLRALASEALGGGRPSDDASLVLVTLDDRGAAAPSGPR